MPLSRWSGPEPGYFEISLDFFKICFAELLVKARGQWHLLWAGMKKQAGTCVIYICHFADKSQRRSMPHILPVPHWTPRSVYLTQHRRNWRSKRHRLINVFWSGVFPKSKVVVYLWPSYITLLLCIIFQMWSFFSQSAEVCTDRWAAKIVWFHVNCF